MTPFHVCARSTPVPVFGPPVGWTRMRCACICTQYVEVDAIRPRMVGGAFSFGSHGGAPFFLLSQMGPGNGPGPSGSRPKSPHRPRPLCPRPENSGPHTSPPGPPNPPPPSGSMRGEMRSNLVGGVGGWGGVGGGGKERVNGGSGVVGGGWGWLRGVRGWLGGVRGVSGGKSGAEGGWGE